MKILLVSDLHANAFALRAVWEKAPAHDAVLCLGDIVGYGAQPNECCEMLREVNATCLQGNHDAAACGHPIIERFNAVARSSSEWTQQVLMRENRAFLEGLQPYRAFEEWEFEVVHASLDDPLAGYIQGVHSARATWKRMRFGLCFFGHTHRAAEVGEWDVPGKRYQTVDRSWREGGRFGVRGEGWRTLVNVGSVGLSREKDSLARFGVFDSNSREMEIFAIEYDVEAARRSVGEAGLPPQLAERLTMGR